MLQRLKKKVFKRHDSAAAAEKSENSSQSDKKADSRPEKYGLFLLASAEPDSNELRQYPVDIIAVHGLAGDAFGTWRHANGTLWLRDLLPKFLPGCRVYTYGYPSKVFSNALVAQVQEYSRALLSSIRDLHDDSKTVMLPTSTTAVDACPWYLPHRSNIPARVPDLLFLYATVWAALFALVLAHQDDNLYSQVLRSIIGIVFLGTPHRGSDTANLGSILGTIVNICAATSTGGVLSRTVRTGLLDHLTRDSSVLQELLLSARNRFRNIAVVSFYETEPTPPLSTLVVNRASSILGIPDEDVIPLYENHKGVCRFSGETSSYMAVSRALRRIANQSLEVTQTLKRTSTHSSQRTLSEIEKMCMMLFNAFDVSEYRRLLPKPITGTCIWIRNHPLFVSWIEKASSAVLWLTGHAGCGKTILSLSLAQHFEQARTAQTPQHVLIYFCDDKVNKQKDAKAILIGLIFQIIHRHRSLIQYVRKAFELQGPSIIQSFSSLWSIFSSIAKDPKCGLLYVILDALDECERITCHQLLDSISEMITSPQRSSRSTAQIKFLITSRPFLRHTYLSIGQSLQSQISIDDGQPGYTADLQSFIQHRVEEISLRRNYSTETKDYLLKALSSKADQTFLWTHMVLSSVENSLLTSLKDLRNTISKIPPDLETTYLKFLSSIPTNHQNDAESLLKLLLASSRPLQLDEVNIAFTINDSHVSTDDVMRDCQSAMSHTLQGILGPLTRISESTVSLVHQSVKEFFLGVGNSQSAFHVGQSINTETASLHAATACIYYLLLDDFTKDLYATESSPIESIWGNFALDDDSFSEKSGDGEDEEDAYNLNADTLFQEPGEQNAAICRSITSKHQFYSYAALNWAHHFSQCENIASPEVSELAKRLLNGGNGSCRNWLQFYTEESVVPIDGDLVEFDPMVLAAFFGLRGTLEDILNTSEHPQAKMDEALFWASRFGHSRIVSTLLEAGAEPNIHGGRQSQTPLVVAAENGHLDCVLALLADRRTDVNMPGRSGRTALSFACANGHDPIVKQLLSRDGCNLDGADNTGATPFFWAVGERRTAISWAAGDGSSEMIKYLLKIRGVDPNAKDSKGRSPLSWAAGDGCADAVDVLVQSKKVDKTSIDKDRRNAISRACEGGHLNALRSLLKHGCPGVDDEDIDHWTPLAWAIQNNSPQVVRALLSTGSVDLHRRDHAERTALSWAVEYGHLPVVKVLLQEGADAEVSSEKRTAPINVAKQSERSEILNELHKYTSSRRAS
ncbi:Vegetative incompatibility HET-E-1-like protein [Cladobotryum mycophilum]|uniref:Vegetative incompatibility HET-E-1-like protein n=1 Tax=Cladobotryum mycophilum TaxID=491253 RepID=A0ABR0SS91_9HYPO